MKRDQLTPALRELLGDADFIRLVEAFGGTRLYVPPAGEGTRIPNACGREIADKLATRYAGDSIPVPLAKQFRALHYRGQGMTNAAIAVRLGLAEASVNRIFRTADDVPEKGQFRQLTLF